MTIDQQQVVVDEIGGVEVRDPFRNLEDDTPPVLAWQQERDAQARAELRSSPRAAAVREAVGAAFVDLGAFVSPQRRGGRWFRTVVPTGRTAPVLEVADTPDGPGRTVLDPSSRGSDATLAGWSASPDGRRVVVTETEDGHLSDLRVLDVDSGAVLLDAGAQPEVVFLCWHPDGHGFFHSVIAAEKGTTHPVSQIWWRPLEGPPERQALHLDEYFARPAVSADGRYVAVFADFAAPRPHLVRDLRATDAAWLPFLPDATATYDGEFVGDELWLVTNDTSAWYRLVAIPVDGADTPSRWREVVPAREGTRLSSVTRCGSRIVLSSFVDGLARLTVLDPAGGIVGDLPLPVEGAVGTSGRGHMVPALGWTVLPDGDEDACTFVAGALDHPPAAFRADLIALTVEEIVPSPVSMPASTVGFSEVPGRHGPVRYRMLRRAEVPLDGSAPVVVAAYGGFNLPWLPAYWPMAAAWTALGGVWIHAHVRGGGEFDDEFWHAGRLHRKQGSFDDLFAVVEDLHRRGVAVPDRTGVWGESNGGLLAGAALTQRPELFGAIVAQVPVLDLMQTRRDPMVVAAMSDWGHPDDPADAPVLHAYSPYHRVVDGTAYPAALLDFGADDPKCPPWHGRKMAARLTAASSSGRRVLLRVRDGVGHIQLTEDKARERDTEQLTFLAEELGRGGFAM